MLHLKTNFVSLKSILISPEIRMISAPFTTVFHKFPIVGPLFSPTKGSVANNTDFGGKIFFLCFYNIL